MTRVMILLIVFLIHYCSVFSQNITVLGDTIHLKTVAGFWELKDTLPDGEWTVYTANKKAIAIKAKYQNSVRNGIYTNYNLRTKKPIEFIGYLDGKRHGIYTSFLNNEIAVSGVYNNGERDGLWIFKDENWDYDTISNKYTKYRGLYTVAEILYNKGKKITITNYYKNGYLRQITYMNPYVEYIDSIKIYFDNGRIKNEFFLLNNSLTRWNKYYSSGQKQIEVSGEFFNYSSIEYTINKAIEKDSINFFPLKGIAIKWSESGEITDKKIFPLESSK